nr:pol polyprotein [Hymenolepis microstoma]
MTHLVITIYSTISLCPISTPSECLKKLNSPSLCAPPPSIQKTPIPAELGDRPPSQLLHHMRFLPTGRELKDEILIKLWMKCLPGNIVPFLITSPPRDDLDKSDVNAGKTSVSTDILSQQQFEKLELLVADSLRQNRRRSITPSRRRSSSRHVVQICYYRRTYGVNAKKFHPGCNYPRADSAFSKLNTTGPEVSIIPRSLEKCILQPTDLTLLSIPLRDTSSASVVKALIESWISIFGVPSVITTDKGAQFTSVLFLELNQLLGSSHIRTTAYHPDTSRLVERFHQQLKSATIATSSNLKRMERLPTILLPN